MVSFPLLSRREMVGTDRIFSIAAAEPMNLNVHSGGMVATMCVNSAGR